MEKTSRGFNVYATIVDDRGSTLRVQQSSADPLNRVYLFTRNLDGAEVMHWKPGGGWEMAKRPGQDDPPWKPGDPMRVQSEGWMAVSPHLSPANCRELIAALEKHLEIVGDDEPEDKDE